MPKVTHNQWAFHYKECVRCHRTSQRHKAKGLCFSCYTTTKYRKYRIEYKNNINFGGNRNIIIVIEKNCQVCGCVDNIVVHHIDRNSKNNHISNLTVLCRSCHSGLHKYFKWKEKFKNCKNLLI